MSEDISGNSEGNITPLPPLKKKVTLDDYLNTRKKQIKVLKKLLDQIPIDSQKIVDSKINQPNKKLK
jgi:hypothetical protein